MLSLVYFFRLGSTDVVEWDEAYYSYRVLDIIQNNNWLDQIANPSVSFWIGSHPPLVIWAMVISTKIFGLNEWGLRIPGVLCAVICVLFLFRFVSILSGNKHIAFIASLILLLNIFFARYARMVLLDVPVLMWILISLFYFYKAYNGKNTYYFISGIAFGLALMSKIIVGFLIPITIFLFILIEYFRSKNYSIERSLYRLATVVLIGLIVSLPWYLYMIHKWGWDFVNEYLVYHVFKRISEPVEGHASNLGILYYPVEIINDFVLFTPFIFFGFYKLVTNELMSSQSKNYLLCMLSVPFIIFTVTETKYPTYTLMFIIPLISLAGLGVYIYMRYEVSKLINSVILVGGISCLVWYEKVSYQMKIENITSKFGSFHFSQVNDFLIALILLTAFVLVIIFFYFILRNHVISKIPYLNVLLCILILILPSLRLSYDYYNGYNNGWIEIRKYIRNNPSTHFHFLVDKVDNKEANRFYTEVINMERNENKVTKSDITSLDTLSYKTSDVKPDVVFIIEKSSLSKFRPGINLVSDFYNDKFIITKNPY